MKAVNLALVPIIGGLSWLLVGALAFNLAHRAIWGGDDDGFADRHCPGRPLRAAADHADSAIVQRGRTGGR